MNPIQIDAFYPLPEGWVMCNPCELMMAQADLSQPPENRSLDELSPELIEDVRRFSAAIYAIAERFQEQVQIKVWDPRSLQGLLKSIRYGVHRYPTYFVNGRSKLVGWDAEKLEQIIQSTLESTISAL